MLQEILCKLTPEEKQELYLILSKEMAALPVLVKEKALINTTEAINCPHCNSQDFIGHGLYRGRNRYKCNECHKTFNDYTGTAISGIKKSELFQQYIEMVVESISIRKAAKRLGVSVSTVFFWRHKLLSSLAPCNGNSFQGIVECDDKEMDINDKGSRELIRKPYKRSSDRHSKPGSDDKVSIVVATDRKGNPTMQVAKLGRIDALSIEKSIGSFINKENILCSDSNPSIVLWAKNKKLEHHTFISKNQHVKNKCYHVQHVNSMDNLFERWMKRFYGVNTKYLRQYLNWFIFLRKTKDSPSILTEFAKTLISNTKALSVYRTIEETYLELYFTQYSKT